VGLAGALFFGRQLDWGARRQRLRRAWDRLGAAGQLVVTALAGGLLYLTSWLTWGQELVSVTRRFGDAVPIAVTALTAGLFYFSPSLVLALLALAALFVLFYLRLDLALAFTALFFPFYLQYRLLWQRGFSMVEVCTLLTLAAWLLHSFRPALSALRTSANGAARPWWSRLTLSDWAVLAYLVIATLSTLVAEHAAVAIREYRLVILEPVLYYLVLRSVRLDRPALWRVAGFFVLGAVAVAGIGLFEYLTGADPITAEGGLVRVRSVYGSPNNLALYLDRALPLAVAVALMGQSRARRWAYAAAALVLALTTALTFSRGALLLGVPAGLTVVVLGWRGRRALWALAAAAAAGLLSLPLLARVPRFAGLLDLSSGTSFFRLRLWVSAWRMFLDHPWLGVGPDNFLYFYRGRYILPEAWEEPDLSHPHNLVLDFLTRVGVFGFLAGLALLLAFWRRALTNHRRLAGSDLLPLNLGLMGAVAAMLAHGLVDHSFFLVDLSFVFFLALGLVHHLGAVAVEAEPPSADQLRFKRDWASPNHA
jgi:O-antigen ligase